MAVQTNPLSSFPTGISSYGLPTFGPSQNLPLGGTGTVGQVWFVDGTNGSDGNNGLYPTTAFLTIATALAACTANANDTVYVAPGTYTLTATLTMSKAKVNLIGMGGGSPGFAGPNLTASAIGAAMFRVAASGVTIQGFTFTGEASRACLDCSVASSFALIKDCEFIVPSSATAQAVAATAVWTEALFQNCTFKGLGTITALVTLTGSIGCRFVDCWFQATTTGTITTGFLLGTGLGALLKNCTFMERDGAVFTLGADFAAGTYSFAQGCFFNMGTQGNSMTITGTGNGALGCNVASGTI